MYWSHFRLKLVLVTAVSTLLAALFIETSYTQTTAEDHLLFLPLIANNYDPNWQWQEPIPITLSPTPNHTPIMVIDHLGNLHIFWDTITSPRFVYHS